MQENPIPIPSLQNPKHINMCNHTNMRGDHMPNMTLALTDDIYKIVKSHKEIKWSQIARKAIEDYARKLVILDALTKNSEITEADIMELDVKIKKGLHEHYLEKMKE